MPKCHYCETVTDSLVKVQDAKFLGEWKVSVNWRYSMAGTTATREVEWVEACEYCAKVDQWPATMHAGESVLVRECVACSSLYRKPARAQVFLTDVSTAEDMAEYAAHAKEELLNLQARIISEELRQAQRLGYSEERAREEVVDRVRTLEDWSANSTWRYTNDNLVSALVPPPSNHFINYAYNRAGAYNHDRLCFECSINYEVCVRCDGIDSRDELYHVNDNDDAYCEACREATFWYCGHCDFYHWQGDRCECDCGDCDEDESGLVHDYSYKPRPIFYTAKGEQAKVDNLYLGFELEIEYKNAYGSEVAEALADAWGDRAYMKRDGSLNNGVELVSHPMTLAAHKENPWESLRTVSVLGARAWNTSTCGLHVHISRKAFRKGSASHLYLFGKFFVDNRTFVEGIAGRTSCSYASFDYLDLAYKSDIKGDRYAAGRYTAVNYQNDKTIEVRIFKPSLRWQRVMADLEFCDAVVRYTATLTTHTLLKMGGLTPRHFVGWLTANADRYPNLIDTVSVKFPELTDSVSETEA